MTLKVLRSDKQPQPDEAEIVKDYRKWAKNIGYILKQSIPVKQGRMQITLETWEHPHMVEHAYLLYHPEIPTSKDTEALYILETEEELDNLVEISKQMAAMAMQMMQARNDIRNAQQQ